MLTKSLYLFFGTLLFCLNSDAQVTRKGMKPAQRRVVKGKSADFSLQQFLGKWQEFERVDRSDAPVSFTDSIQLYFTDTNKVQTRTSISNTMTLSGDADIDDDNNLMVAADVYTIKSMAKNILVLDDNDKYIHRLKKVDEFWYESLGKNPVKQDEYNAPVNVALDSLLGKWSVYKRIAKPGAVSDDMLIIKYLNITEKTGDNSAKGNITFYSTQSSQQLDCTINLNGGDIKITAGQNTWSLSVFQAANKSMIFGNAALMYFAKAEK
ncbi:hypothetical protein [Ferruginibacter albus]|uniref:hypothetical protein n=1 Tax=Ferruginibacter albus TaxID=2875540 RepID=UPI001CC7A155|nr:hypothetical protein [Ferruginibacter albus]UAY51975.1 hypothetical protein K9M53_15455 [Ferruginibacter albus]